MPAGDNIARFTNGLDMMGQQALGFRDPQGPQEADTKAARDAAIQAAVDIITGLMATDAEVAAAVTALLPLAGGVLTGPTTTAPVALADAATIAVNAGLGNLFRVTITANRTLGSPTGGTDGQVIRVEVAQNATGGWTLGYGAKYLGSDDLPLPAIAAGPSKRTVLTFEFDQAADKWLLLGKNAGYQL